MIRVAAVGDVHYDRKSRNRLKEPFKSLEGSADLLLIAGDLTQSGFIEEALALAEDLKWVRVPIVAVLGNHDYNQNMQDGICEILKDIGVIVLEGSSTKVQVNGTSVGIAGLKGFGGGFESACCSNFGEPEMKAFAGHAKHQAEVLERILGDLQTDYRFVLLHYSPVEGTLLGERREVYPFLGSYLLGEAIDTVGADGVFHGHAHYGVERASTVCGITVRNVAQVVIRHAYHVYSFAAPTKPVRQE